MSKFKEKVKSFRARWHGDLYEHFGQLRADEKRIVQIQAETKKQIEEMSTSFYAHIEGLQQKICPEQELTAGLALQNVYSTLDDEISRRIFMERLNCSVKKDRLDFYRYLLTANDLTLCGPRLKKLREIYAKREEEPSERIVVGVCGNDPTALELPRLLD